MPKAERVVIRVTSESRAQLEELAARCGRPLAHVVRAALAQAEQAVPRAWFDAAELERAAGAGERATAA